VPILKSRRILSRAVLFMGAITLTAASALAQPLQEQARKIISSQLKTGEYSIVAQDLSTGAVLFSFSPERSVAPASNLKVVTSAFALKTLGSDYAFKTQLILVKPEDWKNIPQGSSVTNPAEGYCLIVKGDGDPSFGDDKVLKAAGTNLDALLKLWVDQVKKAGVTKVDRLIIDDRIFERLQIHPEWPEDQLEKWYCAPVAGLNINTNCFDITATPTRPGQAPTVKVEPRSPFLTITNKATTGSKQTLGAHVDADNDITIQGIELNTKDLNPEPINVTMKDPPIYFGRLLANRLVEAGISVASIARPTMDDHLPAGKPLHVIQTPLSEVLKRCNKDSQNLYAESLLKRALHQVSGRPGAWADGKLVPATLAKFIGNDDANDLVMADGSGLSKHNRVTARLMVKVLEMLYKDPKLSAAFADSLAVGGQDGTLEKRFKATKAVIRAKTGTISGVSSLSGYVTVGDGPNEKTVAFSFIFNKISGAGEAKATQNQLVDLIADKLDDIPAKKASAKP
jgi:serine-type D-Ala-D-Ala carboxypeptidase/endopeptidase (penicillin-binding protein 4)